MGILRSLAGSKPRRLSLSVRPEYLSFGANVGATIRGMSFVIAYAIVALGFSLFRGWYAVTILDWASATRGVRRLEVA